MYTAKIADYYVGDSGIFYLLTEKLDMAPILNRPLNRSETLTEARDRWNVESHWLAVFDETQPFEGYFNGCTVRFDFTSTTFHKSMRQGTEKVFNIRNINVTKLELVS